MKIKFKKEINSKIITEKQLNTKVELLFNYYCGLINDYADKFFNMFLRANTKLIEITKDNKHIHIIITLNELKKISDNNLDFHIDVNSCSLFDWITTDEYSCLYEDFTILNK